MVFAEEIAQAAKQAATDAGFDLAGIAPVRKEDMPELGAFIEWVDAGRAGEMKYLESRTESGDLRRASATNAAPWVRSMVVCALNYSADKPYSVDANDPERGWISRYAWGTKDYHDALLPRLRQVEAAIKQVASSKTLNLKPAAMSIPVRFLSAFTPSMPELDGLARIPALFIRKWARGFFWELFSLRWNFPQMLQPPTAAEAAPAALTPAQPMPLCRRASWTRGSASPISPLKNAAPSLKNCVLTSGTIFSAAISARTSAHGTTKPAMLLQLPYPNFNRRSSFFILNCAGSRRWMRKLTVGYFVARR